LSSCDLFRLGVTPPLGRALAAARTRPAVPWAPTPPGPARVTHPLLAPCPVRIRRLPHNPLPPSTQFRAPKLPPHNRDYLAARVCRRRCGLRFLSWRCPFWTRRLGRMRRVPGPPANDHAASRARTHRARIPGLRPRLCRRTCSPSPGLFASRKVLWRRGPARRGRGFRSPLAERRTSSRRLAGPGRCPVEGVLLGRRPPRDTLRFELDRAPLIDSCEPGSCHSACSCPSPFLFCSPESPLFSQLFPPSL